jgi:hypothetical protein
MKSFYVTVTSSEPCDYFENTQCEFKNYLPTPIVGSYEMALVGINYLYSGVVIPRNTLLGINLNGNYLVAKVDMFSPADLSKQLEEYKRAKWPIHNVLWKSIIMSKVDFDNGNMVLSEKFYNGNVEMNIFSSNIELERFGNGMKPLLRSTCFYSNKHGVPVEKTFENLQYKKVHGNYQDSIHIYIRNEQDQPLPIRNGRVTLTLHFRDALRAERNGLA